MERLTEKVFAFNGTSCMQIKDCDNDTCDQTCGSRTGIEGCEGCPIQIAIDKLAEYEDLEEQGKLLKLHCAVGDTVYTLNTLLSGKTIIGETTADAFMCALGMLEGRFGETIFLTKEVAEAKLAEMEGKK